MNLISYAQNCEDILLWRALNDIPCGTYLDVGAQHPDEDSVSKLFYERGWRGAHVEANPVYADLLRIARPDETVIEGLVTSRDQEDSANFYIIPETGLSTGVTEIAGRHAKAGFEVAAAKVKTISLEEILATLNDRPIHWMKIDVEGMERDVLESWRDHPARPWVLSVESTLPNSQIESYKDWIDLILSKGYSEVFFDGLNRYFVHADHADRSEAFRAPPNLFDQFAVTAAHHTAGLIVQQADATLVAERQVAQQLIANLEAESRQRDHAIERLNQSRESLKDALDTAHQAVALADARLVNAHASANLQQSELLKRLDNAAADLKELRLQHEAELQAERDNATQVAAVSKAALSQLEAEWLTRLNQSAAESAQLQQQLQDQLEKQRAEAAIAAASRENTWRDRHAATLAESAQLQQHLQDQLEEQRAEAAIVAEAREDVWRGHHAAVLAEQSSDYQAQIEGIRQAQSHERLRLQESAAAMTQELWTHQIALIQAQNHVLRIVHLLTHISSGWWAKLGSSLGLAPATLMYHDFQNQVLEQLYPAKQFPLSPHGDGMPQYTDVSTLLSLHGMSFVEQAYRSILGREGDEGGVRFYLTRLQEGHSKLSILKGLRRSDEAANHIPGVAGLDAAIRRYRRGNLPVLGPILRLFNRTDGETRHERVTRRLEFQSVMLTQSIADLGRAAERWTIPAPSIEAPPPPPQIETVQALTPLPQASAQPDTKSTKRYSGLAGYFQTRIWGK